MTVRPRSEQTEASGRSAAAVVRAREPFERFYRREYRSVVGLAYALSGSSAACEDLAQEAFVRAHERWETVGAYDKPEAWVRRVAANLAVSRFRRLSSEAKAVTRLGGFRADTSTIPDLPSEADAFWAAVRGLPKRQAQAVALHYLEDLSVAEIAEILGCAPNTVKVHLHKGRRRLATTLGVEDGGDA